MNKFREYKYWLNSTKFNRKIQINELRSKIILIYFSKIINIMSRRRPQLLMHRSISTETFSVYFRFFFFSFVVAITRMPIDKRICCAQTVVCRIEIAFNWLRRIDCFAPHTICHAYFWNYICTAASFNRWQTNEQIACSANVYCVWIGENLPTDRDGTERCNRTAHTKKNERREEQKQIGTCLHDEFSVWWNCIFAMVFRTINLMHLSMSHSVAAPSSVCIAKIVWFRRQKMESKCEKQKWNFHFKFRQKVVWCVAMHKKKNKKYTKITPQQLNESEYCNLQQFYLYTNKYIWLYHGYCRVRWPLLHTATILLVWMQSDYRQVWK